MLQRAIYEGARMVEPPVAFKSKGSNLKIKLTIEYTVLSSKEGIWTENSRGEWTTVGTSVSKKFTSWEGLWNLRWTGWAGGDSTVLSHAVFWGSDKGWEPLNQRGLVLAWIQWFHGDSTWTVVQLWASRYEKERQRLEGIQPRGTGIIKRVRLPFMDKDRLYLL